MLRTIRELQIVKELFKIMYWIKYRNPSTEEVGYRLNNLIKRIVGDK